MLHHHICFGIHWYVRNTPHLLSHPKFDFRIALPLLCLLLRNRTHHCSDLLCFSSQPHNHRRALIQVQLTLFQRALTISTQSRPPKSQSRNQKQYAERDKMYTRPRSSAKKVELSFTNWVLGGSLVSVSSTASEVELERQRRRSAGKARTIVEVDSVCHLISCSSSIQG